LLVFADLAHSTAALYSKPAVAPEDRVKEIITSTILILGALFPIVNPLGNSPIFLLLTRNDSSAARAMLSRRIAMNSFLLLVVSFFIGTLILRFFGISLPVVQVGGGLVVISTGWTMLKAHDEDDEDRTGDVQSRMRPRDTLAQAFYPLTLPLTVGPGSISVAIALGANEPQHAGFNIPAAVAGLVGSLVIAVSIYLCYRFAEKLERLIGKSAMNVIMRLSSFLLVCIGVQILWNGVTGLLKSIGKI
jgi:multiple antibiotic resistance protein